MVELLTHIMAISNECSGGGGICNATLPHANSTNGLRTIFSIVFGVAAAIAVLMIAIGAFRFVTSEGNPDATKRGRETILYALIGLIVAISAEALVAFVLNKTP